MTSNPPKGPGNSPGPDEPSEAAKRQVEAKLKNGDRARQRAAERDPERSGQHGKRSVPTLEHPTEWHKSFSESDRVNTAYVLDWLNHNQKRQTFISRLSAVNVGTLNLILKGTYTSTPTKYIAKLVDALNRYDDRSKISRAPFVETTVFEIVNAVCYRARYYRQFGVIAGDVGTGKTTCLKEYAARNPNTILMESDPDTTPITMLEDLVAATGALPRRGKKARSATRSDMFRAVLDALKGSDRLIILDEAETCQSNCLEYLRRLRDKAQVGIVLAGTELLMALIKNERSQFDQIRSRVGYWPPTLHGITKADAASITDAYFEDEVTSEVHTAIWAYTQGSVRVLTENLLPALTDFGLRKNHALSAGLVHKIGREILTLTPSKE